MVGITLLLINTFAKWVFKNSVCPVSVVPNGNLLCYWIKYALSNRMKRECIYHDRNLVINGHF